MIGIYKITSPTGKIYIGQSIDIRKRRREYSKVSNCKTQIKLYRSLKKHGFENHTFEILEECEIEKLNERERHFQDFYDSIGPNGLNLRLTTTESKSGSMSEETKLKMSNSSKSSRKVIKTETGEVIASVTKLSIILETDYNILSQKLKGWIRNDTGYTYLKTKEL